MVVLQHSSFLRNNPFKQLTSSSIKSNWTTKSNAQTSYARQKSMENRQYFHDFTNDLFIIHYTYISVTAGVDFHYPWVDMVYYKFKEHGSYNKGFDINIYVCTEQLTSLSI